MPLQEKYLPLQSKNKEGAIAQLVEQRTENPCVPGSIPGGTTEKTDSGKGQSLLFLYNRIAEKADRTIDSPTNNKKRKPPEMDGFSF